ncbi:MAG: MFS transporter [Lachnospiraceae bacterium]|nr:MFS transporter [Lachnospiraceae bacterium]
MKKRIKNTYIQDLREFLILWSTQSLSQLGSSMTAFALTLWLYEETGSALKTATLAICSYAPYVIMSIFAGALSDRFDKKKTMLVCDLLAALSTMIVLSLYLTNNLVVWHLYAVNAFSGLMNTVQQPASEVATTLLIPKEQYQRASGLQSLSRSLISILNPLFATALYGLAGLEMVIFLDLGSFVIAFLALLFLIKLPEVPEDKKESVLTLAKEGVTYLKNTPMILTMILFMSGINLVASAFDAVLPGLIIPNPKGGTVILGVVTSFAGIAMIFGSVLVSVLPKPKNRMKVVYITMLISMGVENYMMAFCREPWLWCLGQIIGWILVPVMSANYDVIFRSTVPIELQGRVYACRNTLQFFTIPIGLFLGGFMVDDIFEPFMERHLSHEGLAFLFGYGKGSGAAVTMFVLGIAGTLHCLFFGKKLNKYKFIDN